MSQSRRTYDRGMSRVWMSHVTHMNMSCHTYERVMSHIGMRHVTHRQQLRVESRVSCNHTHKWVMSHMSPSRCTYEWGMSHVWMSHVTHVDESCHTCEYVMSHVWMSHVTHTYEACHSLLSLIANESCLTYVWGMSHIAFVTGNSDMYEAVCDMQRVTRRELRRVALGYIVSFVGLFCKRELCS